jgi:hypothetical protein
MILKIDHIAYSTISPDQEINILLKKGYKLLFSEKLPNPEIKSNLLSSYKDTHKITLLETPYSFNIEFVDHGYTSKNPGYITLRDNDVVEINTTNISSSTELFRGLGFQYKDKNEVFFQSLFNSKKFNIKFNQVESSNNKLDDQGFNCIAFISNSVEKERHLLQSLGLHLTNTSFLKVNNKTLKIFFAQRDKNEILEIIEISK